MVTGVGEVDPFHRSGPPAWNGGEEFGPYVDAMRELQDLVSSSAPSAEMLDALAADLRVLSERLRPWRRPEGELIAGRRHDLPGRGNPFFPPFEIDHQDAMSAHGRVTFSDHHLGGNAAAHGGALSLMFDEVLGWLANSGGRPIARTAFLHINYRNVSPLDVELWFEATIDREEGRKCFASGRLFHGDVLVADVECLFVVLLPGQP